MRLVFTSEATANSAAQQIWANVVCATPEMRIYNQNPETASYGQVLRAGDIPKETIHQFKGAYALFPVVGLRNGEYDLENGFTTAWAHPIEEAGTWWLPKPPQQTDEEGNPMGADLLEGVTGYVEAPAPPISLGEDV